MPVELENKLKRQAAARGYNAKRTAAYVYGTLRKTGWRPKRERQKKRLAALMHD